GMLRPYATYEKRRASPRPTCQTHIPCNCNPTPRARNVASAQAQASRHLFYATGTLHLVQETWRPRRPKVPDTFFMHNESPGELRQVTTSLSSRSSVRRRTQTTVPSLGSC